MWIFDISTIYWLSIYIYLDKDDTILYIYDFVGYILFDFRQLIQQMSSLWF